MTDIQLPQDAHLFILDDDGLVFRSNSQKLFALNTIATFMWIAIEDGASKDECIQRCSETFSINIDQASEYLAIALSNWNDIGLLGEGIDPDDGINPNLSPEKLTNTDRMPSLPQREWQKQFQVELIGCTVTILLEKPSYFTDIDQIIGHFKVDDSQSRNQGSSKSGNTIHVCQLGDEIGIYRNGNPVAIFKDASAIGPSVKSIFLQIAIDASSRQFYFHAGLLSTGEKLIMLPGEQGAGKSTLTTGLVLAGLEYFTDEVALFTPGDPGIRPLPIALCSKSTAWHLLEPRMPELKNLPGYKRLDGKMVKYAPPHNIDPKDPNYDRALPVGYLIFPKYLPDTETQLRPISRAEALQRLMVECLAIKSTFDEKSVQGLVDWISGIECYALPNNSLDGAIEAIKKVI